ncbi:MAG: methylenetetrahydrofolate--tRNA-(uracil(54)-C(5))-methyltransferase (FADH(2)-oxidizing) TrmFO [Oscillospiraceae bacterium]|jgi:methylenetetrahydrofolate--tRNA-(uracil-5-)-methyltransferase|nr:methylenetetrahydrofolate--tRNA-(uracil(54)-C(5))-methyltransferase (FADH(2)-oxidizing) TrmFO [Oscillospiraceae bacterium]
MTQNVTVIGAGLAGCEAAWQLAKRGIAVTLCEMKPEKRSPAHVSGDFAELVCSNSLRSDELTNAVGLLKEELRVCGSLIMSSADANKVGAGGALAVDRVGFARTITEAIRSEPLITVVPGEVMSIPAGIVIIATGPLTSDGFTPALAELMPDSFLSFYDAAAPIVTFDSIDMDTAFLASRYDKGDADYINCPMNREQYETFVAALTAAEEADVHGFDDSGVFEGCMPVEVMARRGIDTLRHGPLKPMGIIDPRSGSDRWSYAIVQLRKDDSAGTLYNLVGFQTHLKFPEQKRVFSMIPGLQNAEFVRYGVMHRNTYINGPKLLDRRYRLRSEPRIRFAGQISGVEGYVESTASGLLAALETARELQGAEPLNLPPETALGALAEYVSTSTAKDFQPMNINFGIMPGLDRKVRDKRAKNLEISERALNILRAKLEK